MQCPKCGKELFDDAKYCPFCGTKIEIIENETKKTATFKEGIVALFSKFFLFKGRSSRGEFNFGFLFLILISSILSIFIITPETLKLSIDMGYGGMYNTTIDYILKESESKNIFDIFNMYDVCMCVVFALFLCAPVYRRLTDCGYNKGVVILLTVLFVVSEIMCSNLLWCLLPDEIYNLFSMVIMLLSYMNLFVLLLCMSKKTKII